MIAAEVPPRPEGHGICGCSPCYAAIRASYAPASDWPIDPVNGRLLCTPERPMPPNAKGQWAHQDTVTESFSDYATDHTCRSCGATWQEELPE